MAKPFCGSTSTRRMSLSGRRTFATWAGIDIRTNEHVVVLADGRQQYVCGRYSDEQPAIAGVLRPSTRSRRLR